MATKKKSRKKANKQARELVKKLRQQHKKEKTKKMEENLPFLATLPKRSLPKCIKTAYPRKQSDCSNPERGLASIEAIYVAHLLLGRNVEGLLGNYYWKKEFLSGLGIMEKIC